MPPRLLLLALAASLAVTVSAQETDSVHMATDDSAQVALPDSLQEDTRTPVLYVLEDDDSRVYLFGSIHVLDAASYPLPDNVEAAYEDAESVAFEIDLTRRRAIERTFMRRAVYTDGRTLRDAMGDQYAKLEKVLDQTGLPAWTLEDYKPWAVQFTVSGLGAADPSYTYEDGVDMHFTRRARADRKEILALETPDQQIDALDHLPERAQVQWLVSELDQWFLQEALFLALIDAWERGDEARLAALMNQMPKRTRLSLLRDRNALWVPQIEAYLARESEDVLVVVGAGHLVGEGSVIAMLRARGYTLTRR